MRCDEQTLRDMSADLHGHSFGCWIVRLVRDGIIVMVTLLDGRILTLDDVPAAKTLLQSLGWKLAPC